MKKLGIAFGALIAIVVLAVVIIPNVINWNTYKDQISEEVEKLTGRTLIIGGDIDVQFLPKPSLVANQIALSSVEGAASPDLVAVRQVEVRVAFAPLLAGNIQIETVRLVEPQIHLEVLSDGRTSWTFEPPSPAAAPETPAEEASEPASANSGPEVVIDAFEIRDGSIEYIDAASGATETIRDIDVNFAAASLTQGPFQADGSLVFRDLRLGIDVDIGSIVEARTFPLNLSIGVGGDSATLNLKGTLLGLDDAPRFRGDLSMQSENIGSLVEALTEGATLPPAMQQSLSLAGALDASANELSFEGFEVDLGGAKGTGNIVGSLNGTPRVTADVTIDRIDVDPWLAASPSVSQDPVASDTAAQSVPEDPASETDTNQEPAVFAMPDGLDVTLAVRVGNISMRGQSVRDVVLDAQLADGEITLNQASLTAPGGTSLSMFALLAARDGKPSVDGQLEAVIADVPALMTWADVEISGITPPGAASINTAITGLGDTFSVRELSLKLDETTVTGAATVVLRDRLAFGATVIVDQLNLDRYLAAADQSAPAEPSSDPSEPGESTQDASPQSQAGPLDILTTFDANVTASVGSLRYSGIPVSDIKADVGLLNGALTIRNFSVGNLASASASVSGTVNDLAGTPTAKDVVVNTRVGDPGAFTQTLGLPLPLPLSAQNIGAPEVAATLNGSLDALTVASQVKAFAGTMSLNGDVRAFDPARMLALDVAVQHADAANLINRLGVAYRPSGRIGGLDFKTNVSGGPTALNFKDIAMTLGEAQLNGIANVNLSGALPNIKAQLSAGPLRVDPFIPAQQRAENQNLQPRVIPAAFDSTGRSALLHLISTVSDRWSREPIDLSVLKTVNSEIGFSSPEVMYQNYTVEEARLSTTLASGVLDVSELSGNVFGGAFNTRAALNASAATPQISGLLTLGDMNIAEAAQSVGVAGASGTLTTRVDVTAVGNSIADWVQSLDGQGGLQVTGVKAQRSLSDVPVIGVTFGPLLQVFELLNSGLGGIIGRGGQTGLGETDITSTFTIADGVVNTQDLRIISNLYQGSMAGDINLPQWNMDVGGQVALDQGLVGALLTGVARIPTNIPFEVSGDIDQPNVKIQGFGRGSQGGGLPIPGLNRLEEKVPGVGGLIQGILGGGAPTPSEAPQQTPSSEPPSQQPPPQQPQRQINPAEQLLRGILGN